MRSAAIRHIDYWQRISNDLHVEVVGPTFLQIASGMRLEVDVLVKNFGAEHGMIIVADASKIAGLHDAIIATGFGFSIMDAPSADRMYEREVAISVLLDWGWTGPDNEAPEWYRAAESGMSS